MRDGIFVMLKMMTVGIFLIMVFGVIIWSANNPEACSPNCPIDTEAPYMVQH